MDERFPFSKTAVESKTARPDISDAPLYLQARFGYTAARLEVYVSEHLNDSGVAAVELIESPEQGIAGS